VISLGLLFGLLAAAIIALIVVLRRRAYSRTTNADGLLIEQSRRVQAYNDRVSHNALSMPDNAPTLSDSYRHI
jgi:hypothetical protein